MLTLPFYLDEIEEANLGKCDQNSTGRLSYDWRMYALAWEKSRFLCLGYSGLRCCPADLFFLLILLQECFMFTHTYPISPHGYQF